MTTRSTEKSSKPASMFHLVLHLICGHHQGHNLCILRGDVATTHLRDSAGDNGSEAAAGAAAGPRAPGLSCGRHPRVRAHRRQMRAAESGRQLIRAPESRWLRALLMAAAAGGSDGRETGLSIAEWIHAQVVQRRRIHLYRARRWQIDPLPPSEKQRADARCRGHRSVVHAVHLHRRRADVVARIAGSHRS